MNRFNQHFTGWLARTLARQEIITGGEANGRLANNTRANFNGDFSADLELAKVLSVSDTFTEWNLRTEGNAILNTQTWTGRSGTFAGGTASATSILTPLSNTTQSSTTTPTNLFLDQKYDSNTVLATATILPQFKVEGGWRFVKRHIVDPGDDLTWHQNWLLLGGVIQPSRVLRLNLNYEGMNAKSADPATTPSNTYTREAPDKIYHFRARATVIPTKWINFAVTGNAYSAKNDDPQVNHTEHNHDFSFAAQILPTQTLSIEFNFAHDDVFSETDLCYVFTPNLNAALPAGAQSRAGTCANSSLNGVQPYLGYGTYDSPNTYVAGAITFAPEKYIRFNGGARLSNSDGRAELVNPLMVPGALDSKVISPFADLQVNVARQWTWHGNWEHHCYDEASGAGPAARTFHGDVLTLGVKRSF